jgi:N-acetyl-gamma-glutamyl-phosphate reductase
LAHPGVQLAAVTSTSAIGQKLCEALPAFRGLTDIAFEAFDAAKLAKTCDVVFLGVPGKESMAPGAELRKAGVRVIDIGPDFRLKSAGDFAKYYNTQHTAPGLLQESVYGLVPFYREAIRDAQLVAVPGCYPISVVLALRPLLGLPLADIPVVADCVSGVSGAGRTPNEVFHFPEMNENLRAYKIGVHQHVPEIEQELLHRVLVQFTPHVAPLTRGILSTMTVRLAGKADIAACYDVYRDEPYVRVYDAGQLPEVRYIRGSNFCDIGWVMDERTGNLVIVSAIDNLNGGTAGMAVQCLNLMFGLDETTGLGSAGMAP